MTNKKEETPEEKINKILYWSNQLKIAIINTVDRQDDNGLQFRVKMDLIMLHRDLRAYYKSLYPDKTESDVNKFFATHHTPHEIA